MTWRAVVAAVVAGAALGWWISPARGVAPVAPDIAPCASDDGSGPRPCFWDATRRGNGAGVSFLVDSAGGVHYADGTSGGE